MKPKAPTIAASYVRNALEYFPQTGEFVRKSCGYAAQRFVGKPAGFVHHTGYLIIKIDGKPYLAHRLAWAWHYGEWPSVDFYIDHINGDKLDNRISNLRLASHTENIINTEKSWGETGFRGVQIDKRKKSGRMYFATIRADGKEKYLGCYHTAQEAHDAYRAASIGLHGEFAPGHSNPKINLKVESEVHIGFDPPR